MIEELTIWNEQLAERSTSLARNQAIIDRMVMNNEKTTGVTIELDDSLSSKGNMGKLHFSMEQGDNLNNFDLPIDLSRDSSFIVLSIMVHESLYMICANDSYVETLPKEILSLCAQAFKQEVEIMHLNVSSNEDLNSSYKSHIGEEVEESLGENLAVNNMSIDDEEVGSLVSDAIDSYDITSYDCVSSSPLIHSPPIERESTINHPNFVNEECYS